MEILSITTPALLFSAISLILLAYTNRFLAYANIIRSLYSQYQTSKEQVILDQIKNLRKRLYLTRSMQLLGVLSLLLCIVTMFLIYIGLQQAAIWIFGVALVLLIASLVLSAIEIQISTYSLDLHLSKMEEKI